MSDAATQPRFSDIIIAVHGIGEQSRFSTVRSVATRLAGSQTLSGDGKVHPVAPQPLGYFHGDIKRLTSVRLLDDADTLKNCDLETIGVAEVFWADIPEEVVKEGRTLEETKAWARTVVARAHALYERAQKDRKQSRIVPPDFGLAAEVLDEIIETVYVFENLVFLGEKAGLFKFDLRELLEQYLGDVQLVAEFNYYRMDVVGRFHHAMENIYEQQCKLNNREVRLHIVAHSEGTVVSFLGMLHAMSGRKLIPADPQKKLDAKMEPTGKIPDWLKHLHGYMTIGSPIDKHLLLWQRLWTDFDPKLANAALPAGQIRWRNYYDYGDPVGFKLDTARLWLNQKDKVYKAFEFCGCKKCRHDIGFSRYLFPGEAHNEYWNDPEVFEHFITNVIKEPHPGAPQRSKPKPPPRSKPLVAFLSPTLPYLCSFLVLLLGVFILFKAVHAYTHPSYDNLQRYVRFMELGVRPGVDIHGWGLLSAVCGMAALLSGATLFGRFPRLAVGRLWTLVGILSLEMGCALYVTLVSRKVRMEIGSGFWPFANLLGPFRASTPTVCILGFTVVAAVLGYLVTCPRMGSSDRQQRWLFRGMRPLILCGAIAIGLVILSQLFHDVRRLNLSASEAITFSPNQIALIQDTRLTRDELKQIVSANPTNWETAVQNVKPVLDTDPPVWPVVFAGAAFLYLWWLSTLLFDLAFVWHRYVRHSTTNNRLREWNSHGLSPRWKGNKEPCNKEPVAQK